MPLFELLRVDLDPLVSFPQILVTGVQVQLLDLCLAVPCPRLLTQCSAPCFPGSGTESGLCFVEAEVKCSGTEDVDKNALRICE